MEEGFILSATLNPAEPWIQTAILVGTKPCLASLQRLKGGGELARQVGSVISSGQSCVVTA